MYFFHVFSGCPLGSRNMAQAGGCQIQAGFPVRKRPDDAGAPSDLAPPFAVWQAALGQPALAALVVFDIAEGFAAFTTDAKIEFLHVPSFSRNAAPSPSSTTRPDSRI